MMYQTIFYLFLFHFSILINSLEFNPTDYELYGPTLAANDQFIVTIQNRTAVTFSAVSNYLASSPNYCTLTYTPPIDSEFYATMVAVGGNGLATNNINKFVFIGYSRNETTIHLLVASVNFSPCQLTISYTANISNDTYPRYSVLGVDSNGLMAFYFSDSSTYIQSLIPPYASSPWSPITILNGIALIPTGINLQNNWGILGVYMRHTAAYYDSIYTQFTPTAFQMNFTNCLTYLNSSCYQLTLVWQIGYPFTWQSSQAPPDDVINNEYDSLYEISISINNQNYVLFGIQSVNMVFCFSSASTSFSGYGSRLPGTIPSIGFGKGVGWLDNTTAAILSNNFTLDYAQWRSSDIELYPITSSNSLSNSINAYASFPNSHQQLWSQLNPRLIHMLAISGSGSIIFMDYVGNVFIIRPSATAYFVYTSNGIGALTNTIYVAPTLGCPSGTIKNQSAYGKDILRYCILCAEGTFYSANYSNQTNQCTPCDTSRYFCPWGAVAELPVSVLDTITQAQVYPQSPDNDDFEDILLLNMFSTDFNMNCLSKQPLFYALAIIGIGCVFLLFMGILKLTGKLKKQRRMMKKFFKQTDLIGEGELWIGGVASLAIVVIAVFAYTFSSGFMHQYPIESVGNATFACDPTLRNAKFSTSMQSLGTPVLDEEQTLFDMLDNQQFTLNIAFINTDFSQQDLAVSQVLGSILLDLTYTTNQTNGILAVSTNLTSHSTTVQFNVSSNSAVGALRVGLTGPSIANPNYYVQQLNFSSVFNYTNRTVTQDPMITIELIMLINETEPLSSNGDTKYSGIWIPSFVINVDEIFYTDSDFQLYHVNDETVLTVQITEATYYIYNKQEPITKVTELIFTDILFTTMCIELFGLIFLFFKLAILPIIKYIFGFCTRSNKVTPKKHTGGGGGGVGCPYCRSVDPETLPAYRVAVQRAEEHMPTHAIRRHSPNIAKLHIV